MKKVTVSAPGKLMLFGEHAVVYNHPCIVTSINERIYLTAEITNFQNFELQAPEVGITNYTKNINGLGKGKIPKGAKFVEIAVKNVFEKYSLKNGIKITTQSDFSSEFGFGSSSASTVCTVKAVSELFKLNLSNKDIFEVSYKTVLDIQNKGSGFDVAAAAYGGTLYFLTEGKIIEALPYSLPNLVVGYSGIKADTVTLINSVKDLFNSNPKMVEGIYESIELLTNSAKNEILLKHWQLLGTLMNENHKLLCALGVSIPRLDEMIEQAVNAGAYGAKLSGAGGGDCMIALSPKEKTKDVENAIINAGGKILKVKMHTEGVKVE